MIRWFQGLLPEPDKFHLLADRVIPKGSGGFGYFGYDLSTALGIPNTLHLYIHYGMYSAYPGWGSVTFSPSQWSGDGPSWRFQERFHTRGQAVKALARSLRLLDAELGQEDPNLHAVRALATG